MMRGRPEKGCVTFSVRRFNTFSVVDTEFISVVKAAISGVHDDHTGARQQCGAKKILTKPNPCSSLEIG